MTSPMHNTGEVAISKGLSILSPLDGDMLHESDGTVSEGILYVRVVVSAPPGLKIAINGIRALYGNETYGAEVPLRSYRTVIEAREESMEQGASIAVYWLRQYTGKYRLSLDDNIWFLQDIASQAQLYKSIFENPYLEFLRQVHCEYGTKVHVNVFFQTEGFSLRQMPGKYRGEWQDNSDWLRLSFHALQNEPDRPYRNADYEQVKRDCEMVQEQVRRFAGDALLAPVTTLHWGEAGPEGCRALRDCGYLCLVGYFNVDDDLPPVSYYLDADKRRHLKRRSVWKDNEADIVFVRSAIVIDRHRREGICPYLDAFRNDPQRSGFADLLVHEQYFHPHYAAYQPDYRLKVLAAVQWANQEGYKPAFLSECLFDRV